MITPMHLLSSLAVATLLMPSHLNAEDFTIQPARFEHSITLNSTALPVDAHQIILSPKALADFTVEKVLPHGSRVKKGDKLYWIDTENLDTMLLEMEKSREADALNLAKLQQELDELKIKTAKDLEWAQIVYDRASQDHDYFIKVSLPQMIASHELQIQKAQWYLDNRQEELTQLLKMYAADGLTEDTEEIIVQRAKNDVHRARFEHDEAIEEAKRNLEVILPRKKLDAEIGFATAKRHFDSSAKHLKRNLQLQQATVEKALRDDANKQKQLAQMQADRKLADLTAPADGILYYGEFIDAKWDTSNALKSLAPGAKLVLHKPLMTIVPDAAPLQLQAMVDSSTASELKDGQKGIAHLPTDAWKHFSADVKSVATVPNLQNKWDIFLTPIPVEGTQIFPGSAVSVSLTTYVKENAISIPSKAIQPQTDGSYAVQLKMADGKTSLRPVTVGHVSKDKVEILTGLEAGQVIVYDK